MATGGPKPWGTATKGVVMAAVDAQAVINFPSPCGLKAGDNVIVVLLPAASEHSSGDAEQPQST